MLKQFLLLISLTVYGCTADGGVVVIPGDTTPEPTEAPAPETLPIATLQTCAGEPAALLALRGWLTVEAGDEPATECASQERGNFQCTSDAGATDIQLWYERVGTSMAMIMRGGKVQTYARWRAEDDGSTAQVEYTPDTTTIALTLT